MRRPVRVALWTSAAVLRSVVVLIGAALLAANTAGGRALIERWTASLSNGRVRLAGLSGSFPSAIDVAELRLSDDQGTWLTAERISLRWSPLALLSRHVQVDELAIARVAIERRPQSKPEQQPDRTSLPHIDLHHFAVGTLELGAPLAGTRASLSVQGTAHLISLEDAAAALRARRSDGASGDYEISLRFDPASMDASVKIEESAGGALENLLQYPGLGAVSVQARLSGPRGAERLQLDARAGALQARAQGTLDLTHQAGDVTYELESAAMTPRPGLAWRHIALQGRWRGSLRSPLADGRLQVDA